jgi:hypothetical protein
MGRQPRHFAFFRPGNMLVWFSIKFQTPTKPMKSIVMVSCIFAAAVKLAVAGEVTLSLKQTEGLKCSCTLSNATGQQIYVMPLYLKEQFFARPMWTNGPAGWQTERPFHLADWTDLVPLASGTALEFTATGSTLRPWRITCLASTVPSHMTNAVVLEETNKITIHSAEIPPVKIPPSERKTGTNLVKVIGH